MLESEQFASGDTVRWLMESKLPMLLSIDDTFRIEGQVYVDMSQGLGEERAGEATLRCCPSV